MTMKVPDQTNILNLNMMKIGIIGAGTIGYNVAKKLAPNHSVKLAASKLSDELIEKAEAIGVSAVDIKEAVKDVDVVIISIPMKFIPELPKDLFEGVPENVIVAETGNYYPYRDTRFYDLDEGKVESVWVSEQLGRPVIKAFNNILTYTLVEGGRPSGDPDRIAISVAGDNQEAKKVIGSLINETGFDVVDGGSLVESWRQQPGTPAYCTELNSEELKKALGNAIKEKAPVLRDQVIAGFMEKDFNLSKQEIIEANRSGHTQYPKNL
jgi:predicted dinucleotide-binding enzyme